MAQYEHPPCHVVEARYLGDYKVWLEFNDGRKGVVDLADELYGEEFEYLRDRSRFAQFYRIDRLGRRGGFRTRLSLRTAERAALNASKTRLSAPM
jgi:hypothetical protein